MWGMFYIGCFGLLGFLHIQAASPAAWKRFKNGMKSYNRAVRQYKTLITVCIGQEQISFMFINLHSDSVIERFFARRRIESSELGDATLTWRITCKMLN